MLITEIPLGSIVIDNTWSFEHKEGNNYSGAGVVKPIEWMVVANNSHFKQSYYGNTDMDEHVTLISNEIVANYYMHPTNKATPWETRDLRIIFLRDILYNSMSVDFQSKIVLTTTKTGGSPASGPQTVENENIFILSQTEMSNTSYAVDSPNDGLFIPFFDINEKRIARNPSGVLKRYWNRSPSSDNDGRNASIETNGSLRNDASSTSSLGVRPALNLRSDTHVVSTGQTKTNAVGQTVMIYEIIHYTPPNLSLKINGEYKQYDQGWVKVNGEWREIDEIHVKINGMWRKSE